MSLPSTGWHKSSYSTDFQEACVEAAGAAGGAGVQGAALGFGAGAASAGTARHTRRV
ncbi:DUF397 domain-containing protein [Streptomyces sp. NPDC054844]